MIEIPTTEFTGQVRHVPVNAIRPSHNNPRGDIRKDESFERLVSSVREVGLLVPIVVARLSRPAGAIKYELVDGERRFRAATELSLARIPAHILEPETEAGDLRKLMFHLHMTREQWKPLEQCRSLAEAYPQLERGLRFDDKPRWIKKLRIETGMQAVTARDRVRVLAWSRDLKARFFRFDEEQPKKDIYSYILAIEASIIEPSAKAFPNLYNHGHSFARANEVRGSLLEKTIDGFETGAVSSREQIRGVSPLFIPTLPPSEKRVARGLFTTFLKRPDYQFDDIKAEIDARLPSVAKERAPKPQRLIAMIKSLQQTLETYDPAIIQNITTRDSTQKKLKRDILEALEALAATTAELQERLHG
jgi:ParB-like nuclease domain